MSYHEEEQLAAHGWHMRAVWDLCWLDCDEDGYLLVDGDRAICLCPEHAAVLQRGCWGGDYSGAPLPPETQATEWPWQWTATRPEPISA